MENKDILRLINLYRENECLWNIHSKLFRRVDIKNKVYRKIAAEMGIDDESVKKKIRNLRTAYTAERRKLYVAMKSGMAADEIRETALFYFSEMAFLDPYITYRKGTNHFQSCEVMDCAEGKPILDDSSSSNGYVIVSIDDERSGFESYEEDLNSPPQKKNKQSGIHSKINFDDALTKFISSVNAEREKDEYELFGQTIALQLRKLPEEYAIQLMSSIQQQLMNVRLQLIKASGSQVASGSIGSATTSSRQQPTYVQQPLTSAFKLCSKSSDQQPLHVQTQLSSGVPSSSNSSWQQSLDHQQLFTSPSMSQSSRDGPVNVQLPVSSGSFSSFNSTWQPAYGQQPPATASSLKSSQKRVYTRNKQPSASASLPLKHLYRHVKPPKIEKHEHNFGNITIPAVSTEYNLKYYDSE